MDLDDLEDEFQAELAAQERMSKRRPFENDLLELEFGGLYEPALPDDPKDKLCGRCGHKRREHWTVREQRVMGAGGCEGTTLNIDFNCDACKCKEFVPSLKCVRCNREFYEHRERDGVTGCAAFTFLTDIEVLLPLPNPSWSREVPMPDPPSGSARAVQELTPESLIPVMRLRRPSWWKRLWRALIGKR